MKLLWALALVSSLAAATPAEEKAERHLAAGKALLAQGRAKDARAELSVAAAILPERADIKAALDEADGMPAHRVEAAEASPSTGAPRGSGQALAEARRAYRESELQTAEAAWQRALLLDKTNTEAIEGIQRLKAEAYIRDADAPFDASVAELYAAALREARKERLLEARKKLEEALALNPVQAQIKALLSRIESGAFAQEGQRGAEDARLKGEAALRRKDWAEARQALDQALSLKPADPALLKDLALLKQLSEGDLKLLLQKAKKAEDLSVAVSLYKKALAIAPDSSEVLEGLQKAEAAKGQKEGSAKLKQSADALYNQGVDAWQAGRLADAAQYFKQVLELNADDGDARKALDAVQAKLNGAIDKDRAASLALLKNGQTFEAKGQTKEALDAYQRAAAKDPQNRDAASELKRLQTQITGN